MKPPGIARGRRAFLAPIWIAALSSLVVSTVLFVAVRLAVTCFAEISTIIVLRHAERLDAVADTPLSAAGETRAARLAQMFGGPTETGRVRAIYASELRSTRQTAAPLAAQLELPVVTVAVSEVDALVARIRSDGRGKTSLVVASSNTVPQIVAKLSDGRVRVTVDDGDFASLFVVTISSFGAPSVVRLRY